MADALSDRTAEEVPGRLKKSLFKKPILAKSLEEKEHEEGVDFFSRAKTLYPIQIAEEERRRQRKIQKLERKRSTECAEEKAPKTPEVKRRRISSQTNDRSSDSSPDAGHDDEPRLRRASTQSTPGSRRSSSSHIKLQGSPTTLSERYSRDLNTKKRESGSTQANPGIISLMSDSEDDVAIGSPFTIKKPNLIDVDDEDDDDGFYISPPIPEEEEDPMSDEEYPELVQQAREREQKKALDLLIAERSIGESNHTTNGESIPADATDDPFKDPETVVKEPVIDILITSFLPGTKAIIVQRKLSQKFGPARLAWIDRNVSAEAIPPESKASIFLTWRGKRLFDVGTCAFLGLKTDIDGKMSSADNILGEKGRLHLEAWTESLYMEYQKRLQQEENEEEQESPPEEVEKIKLLLKAKNMEPIKIQVKPSTTISKLISYVRESQKIPKEKDVLLYFDGDKLDPDASVADVELGDLDTVEIHYR